MNRDRIEDDRDVRAALAWLASATGDAPAFLARLERAQEAYRRFTSSALNLGQDPVFADIGPDVVAAYLAQAKSLLAPDNRVMKRYVFYSSQLSVDRKVVTAARKLATSLGATVVRIVAGSMLLEATPAKAVQVAKALPGWHYSVETQGHRIPEHSPLKLVRRAGTARKVADSRSRERLR